MSKVNMCIANLNLVFGKNEEPLLSHLDDVVLPALQSGLVRDTSSETRFLFNDVCIKEIEDGEYVLQGLIIKDTVLDIESVLTKEGLTKKDEHPKSSPYSIFIVYLKNHRMILAKNQKGSPDLRAFKSTFRIVMNKYIRSENKRRKEKGELKLPSFNIHVNGIKTSDGILKELENVKKIKNLTLKLFPLNGEWDLNPTLQGLDEIRKAINCKKGKITFPSPGSKVEVANLIAETEGTLETEMEVEYNDDNNDLNKGKTGKIKGNEVSENVTIDIDGELRESYSQVHRNKNSIKSLNVYSPNNVADYEKYVDKLKKKA